MSMNEFLNALLVSIPHGCRPFPFTRIFQRIESKKLLWLRSIHGRGKIYQNRNYLKINTIQLDKFVDPGRPRWVSWKMLIKIELLYNSFPSSRAKPPLFCIGKVQSKKGYNTALHWLLMNEIRLKSIDFAIWIFFDSNDAILDWFQSFFHQKFSKE